MSHATPPSSTPAVTYEELEWAGFATAHTLGLSRSALAEIKPTYRAAIPPRIAEMRFDIDADVLAEAEDARAEITRFDAELSSRFGDVEVAPLAAVLDLGGPVGGGPVLPGPHGRALREQHGSRSL